MTTTRPRRGIPLESSNASLASESQHFADETRSMLLTVDVEALPARAEKDHVERLIWGHFPGRKVTGLREMMNEAEKHSFALTCFFDFCEVDIHGSAFLDVAREIVARGHDLQWHAHPELMSAQTWKRLGTQKPACPLNEFTETQMDRLFDWFMDFHASVSTKAPIAFRGGGYRYSAAVLSAMKRRNLLVSSSHNPGRMNQFDSRASCEIFRHDNGVLEAPISVLYRGDTRSEFNFNSYGFLKDAPWFVPTFQACYGNRAVLNLVTHSRSLLVMDAAKRYFSPDDGKLLEAYRSLLERLRADGIRSTTVDALAERFAHVTDIEAVTHNEGQSSTTPQSPSTALDSERHLDDRAVTQPSAGIATSNAIKAVARRSPGPICTVCRDPESEFSAFNGRTLARCSKCGALERQRSLAQVWNKSLRHEIATKGKAALLVSPAKSERMVLAGAGFDSVVSLDIRPEARCDLVADLCEMPQVADGSFDLVFASHVLPHLHNLHGALSEIARILTPGGAFLSFSPTRRGHPTETLDEVAAGSGWYGPSMKAAHNVGTFHKFGDLGLLRELQKHFVVKTFHGEDPVTRRTFMWSCAWRLDAADLVRALPAGGAQPA